MNSARVGLQRSFVVTQARVVAVAVVIHHEAFGHKFLQGLRRPDPKLRRLVAIHSVADGDDGIEAVEFSLVAFLICGSCFQNGGVFRARL